MAAALLLAAGLLTMREWWKIAKAGILPSPLGHHVLALSFV